MLMQMNSWQRIQCRKHFDFDFDDDDDDADIEFVCLSSR